MKLDKRTISHYFEVKEFSMDSDFGFHFLISRNFTSFIYYFFPFFYSIHYIGLTIFNDALTMNPSKYSNLFTVDTGRLPNERHLPEHTPHLCECNYLLVMLSRTNHRVHFLSESFFYFI